MMHQSKITFATHFSTCYLLNYSFIFYTFIQRTIETSTYGVIWWADNVFIYLYLNIWLNNSKKSTWSKVNIHWDYCVREMLQKSKQFTAVFIEEEKNIFMIIATNKHVEVEERNNDWQQWKKVSIVFLRWNQPWLYSVISIAFLCVFCVEHTINVIVLIFW